MNINKVEGSKFDAEVLFELGAELRAQLDSAEGLVDLNHPGADLLECLLQRGARSFALEVEYLEVVGKRFVVLLLLIEAHRVPCLDAVDPEPFHDRVGIFTDTLARVWVQRDL